MKKKICNFIYYPWFFFLLFFGFYFFKFTIIINDKSSSDLSIYLRSYYQSQVGWLNYLSLIYLTIGTAIYINKVIAVINKKIKNLSFLLILVILAFLFFLQLLSYGYALSVKTNFIFGLIISEFFLIWNLGFLWEIIYLFFKSKISVFSQKNFKLKMSKKK